MPGYCIQGECGHGVCMEKSRCQCEVDYYANGMMYESSLAAPCVFVENVTKTCWF